MQPPRPREPVIFATDFAALVAWYRDVLGLTVRRLFEEHYHYANLESPSGFQVGIADSKEMGVTPIDRAANSVVLQIEVDDVRAFADHLERHGGSFTIGPSRDRIHGYWFGVFTDLEGNPLWIVDKDCP